MSASTRACEIEREYVLKAYDEIAEGYLHWRSKPWIKIVNLAKKFLANCKIVLDAGCGNGRHSEFLLKWKITVVGVDISQKMLETYKRKVGYNSRIHLIQCSILKLPFRSNVFDGIISVSVIHNIPLEERRIKALKELKRVLKRKGITLISVWNISHPKLFLKAVIHKILRNGEFGDVFLKWRRKGKIVYRFYHLYTPKKFIKNVTVTGFKILLVDKIITSRRIFKYSNTVVVCTKNNSAENMF